MGLPASTCTPHHHAAGGQARHVLEAGQPRRGAQECAGETNGEAAAGVPAVRYASSAASRPSHASYAACHAARTMLNATQSTALVAHTGGQQCAGPFNDGVYGRVPTWESFLPKAALSVPSAPSYSPAAAFMSEKNLALMLSPPPDAAETYSVMADPMSPGPCSQRTGGSEGCGPRIAPFKPLHSHPCIRRGFARPHTHLDELADDVPLGICR
jgi:hypothetical protein